MLNKQNYYKLLLFLIIFIMSCNSFENDLAETAWETNDGKITCKFISKNMLNINYNNIQKQFLFYQEGANIKITKKDDYSQYIIKIKDNNLIMDSDVIMEQKNDKINEKLIFTKLF